MGTDLKIGVALGGGGVRGLAHIPALEVIDDCGIKPAALAGTSMGSIVGALYAGGLSGREIRALVEDHIITRDDKLADIYRKKAELLKWLSAVRPSLGNRGLLRADGFLHYLLEQIGADQFEDLTIPFSVMAADFYRGAPAVFDQGPLLPAIRASMSIPGVFVPVELDGRVLVDGGVVNNLPYDLLWKDCDIVIAIDVAPTRDPNENDVPNLIDATLGMFDILVDRVTDAMREERPPTLYVRPTLIGIRTLEFDKIDDVLEQAQPAMEDLRDRLRQLLEEARA